jgi:hypothetical protein
MFCTLKRSARISKLERKTNEYISHFQSNVYANRMLPSSYLFWAVKRLVDYL